MNRSDRNQFVMDIVFVIFVASTAIAIVQLASGGGSSFAYLSFFSGAIFGGMYLYEMLK